jgi:predicted CoA-binding protein
MINVAQMERRQVNTAQIQQLDSAHYLHPFTDTHALNKKGVRVIVYEPLLAEEEFFKSEVTHNLASFKSQCDVIVANRQTPDLSDVAAKVYTRDLFGSD